MPCKGGGGTTGRPPEAPQGASATDGATGGPRATRGHGGGAGPGPTARAGGREAVPEPLALPLRGMVGFTEFNGGGRGHGLSFIEQPFERPEAGRRSLGPT